MSAGRFFTTPWSRTQMKRLGIDMGEVASRIPDNCSLHVTERRPNGPWYVRGFIEHREVTHFDKNAAGFTDLGYGIEFVLAMVRGEVASGKQV